MSVPQDNSKNHPASNNKEQKVIVLSMKNMPSFKFDVSKSLLGSNQDNGQSVFSFKPQQLLPSSHSTLQVAAQSKNIGTNIQVVSSQPMAANTVQKLSGTSSTILIRAQSPTAVLKQPAKSPQQLSLISHPHLKIQETRKISTEVTMKNPAGQTVVLHSSPAVPTITQHKKIIVPGNGQNQTKIYQIPCQNQKILSSKPHVKMIQAKESPKPIPILPKPDGPQKIVLQQHVILPSTVIVQQSPASQQIKSNVITIPTTGSSYLKYNVQQPTKWTIPSVSNISFPPALTPIQPKVTITTQKVQPEKMAIQIEESSSESEIEDDYESNNEEQDENSAEEVEKTPEAVKNTDEEEFTIVKRIIEGDEGLPSLKEPKVTEIESKCDNNEDLSGEAEICEQLKENITATTTSSATLQNNKNNNNNNNNNNSMLLCDEQIASITPEESPETSEKSKEQSTPMHTSEEQVKIKSVEDVKKNLKLDLVSTTTSLPHDANDIENKMEIDESDSILSDDQSTNQSLPDDKRNPDDLMSTNEKVQAEASSSKSDQNKAKRSRKPKNPTVITSLGLPYKPPQPSNRKKKVEKKVELEMDFHDPLNKILWEDGIGGLNNCNKLFGFNEFGLIEVLNKKDAIAKLKIYDNEPTTLDDNGNFKFRKLVEPQDQFVCVICSKYGTVRDFFSPECCSESCFAITKRKSTEYSTSSKDEHNDSGLNTPTDVKKVIYDGELMTLQQMHQYLLEQHLPESKRKQQGSQRKMSISNCEIKFSWESYLTSKSVPAPESLFMYTSKSATTHFRVGMRLEAIDPMNQHMFCVCTVEEKLGCRIKLHFDGFAANFDFWTNSDSFNVFPVGFCQGSGRKLNVPPRWKNRKFDWTEYLDHTNSAGAQRYMFPRLTKTDENPLTVGMKLEVMYDVFWYAATIIDAINSRILIRFDGIYESFGCCWFSTNSPYLNYCDGHKSLDDSGLFKSPFDDDTKSFDWADYLKETNTVESPKEFFMQNRRDPYQFEPGMKLEVVDKVNPQLIRPATVLMQNEYKVQVIFDGFDIGYAYWLDDDSEDVHPINYCKHTEHPIEHPAGCNKVVENSLCSMNGCQGIGNGQYADRYFHDSNEECPYNMENWKRQFELKDNTRLDYKPYIRRIRNTANGSESTEKGRSLLLQNSSIGIKLKKEKQESDVKEEQVEFDETTNDTAAKVTSTSRRAKKRPINRQKVEQEEKKTNDDIDEHRAVKIRVVQHFLENYGPQMNYAYDLWTKNSKVLDKASITDDDLSDNPMKWNVDDVCTFLVKFCDEETTAKFYAQMIDGEALLSLCQKDLVTLMNIKIGPAIKIYNRILWLRQEVMTKFAEF